MFERLGSLTYRYRYLIVRRLGRSRPLGRAVRAVAGHRGDDRPVGVPARRHGSRPGAAPRSSAPSRARPSTSSATLVFARDGGLTDADRAYIEETGDWLTSDEAPPSCATPSPSVATADSRPELESMLRSEDGELEMMTVNLDVVAAGSGARRRRRRAARPPRRTPRPTGLAAHVTGTAAISSDYLAAIVKGTDSTTIVTVVLVIVILLLIYRAPLAALVPLITIGAAFLVARGVLGRARGGRLEGLVAARHVHRRARLRRRHRLRDLPDLPVPRGGRPRRLARRRRGRPSGGSAPSSAPARRPSSSASARWRSRDFGMIQTMGPALAIGHLRHAHRRPDPDAGPAGDLRPLPVLAAPHAGPGRGRARRVLRPPRRRGLAPPRHRHRRSLLVALAHPGALPAPDEDELRRPRRAAGDSDARVGFDAGRRPPRARQGLPGDRGSSTAGRGPTCSRRRRSPASVTSPQDARRDRRRRERHEPRLARGRRRRARRASAPRPAGRDGRRASTERRRARGATDGEALLDPDVDDGLDTAGEYLALLGDAFPDVAASGRPSARRRPTSRRRRTRSERPATAPSSRPSSATSSTAMTSPTAASGGGRRRRRSGSSGDYLDELGAGLPARSATLAAFDDGEGRRRRPRAGGLDRCRPRPLLGASRRWRPGSRTQRRTRRSSPRAWPGRPRRSSARAEIEATFEPARTALGSLSADLRGALRRHLRPAGPVRHGRHRRVRGGRRAFVSDDRTRDPLLRHARRTTPTPRSAFGAVRPRRTSSQPQRRASGAGASAHLGGTTAEFADVQDRCSRSDFRQVAIITILGHPARPHAPAPGGRRAALPRRHGAPVLRHRPRPLRLVLPVRPRPGRRQLLPADARLRAPRRPRLRLQHLPDEPRPRGERGASDPRGHPDRLRADRGGHHLGRPHPRRHVRVDGHGAARRSSSRSVRRSRSASSSTPSSSARSSCRRSRRSSASGPGGRPGARGLGRIAWPITVTMPASDVPVAGLAAASGGGPEDAVGGPTRWRRLAVAVLLVALVPTVFAGLLSWSLADPTARLDLVTAAVVNEDEGATVTAADGTVTKLDLGGDLVARLTGDTDGDTFAWQAIDAARGERRAGGRTLRRRPHHPLRLLPDDRRHPRQRRIRDAEGDPSAGDERRLERHGRASRAVAQRRHRPLHRAAGHRRVRGRRPALGRHHPGSAGRCGQRRRPASRPGRPTSPTPPTARRPWPASSSVAWKPWPTGPLPRARARRRWRRA